MRRFFLTALFILWLCPFAFAHDASFAYTNIAIDDQKAYVNFTTRVGAILALYNATSFKHVNQNDFDEYFKTNFRISNDNDDCSASQNFFMELANINSVLYSYNFDCGNINTLNLTYNMFYDIASDHENLMKISISNSSTSISLYKGLSHIDIPVKKILEQEDIAKKNSTKLGDNAFEPQNSNKISGFFTLGIKHILSGYDHILFLIGILIVTLSFGHLIKIVSSFTVAHSITLGIASLGIVSLPMNLTESIIALSIAYIALENLYLGHFSKKFRFHDKISKYKAYNYLANPENKWAITFFFGLVHGFGFSSVLQEIGLPKEALIFSLLSFNGGVEVGQLIIVSLIFPLLIYLKKNKWHGQMVTSLSAIICTLGILWFVQRAFF